jgi:hypothetical protein
MSDSKGAFTIIVRNATDLDRHADRLKSGGFASGEPYYLLTSHELAAWLRCSISGLEAIRSKCRGPCHIKILSRVACRRSDVLA